MIINLTLKSGVIRSYTSLDFKSLVLFNGGVKVNSLRFVKSSVIQN
ncbi:unnamed protein product [Arabidopsis halleri]